MPIPKNLDPDKFYLLQLNKRAKHGTTILDPRNRNRVRGDEVAKVEPQDAIVSAEPVK